MPPLCTHEFAGMIPEGEKGNLIAEKLSDHLVDKELFTRAESLLQLQIQRREGPRPSASRPSSPPSSSSTTNPPTRWRRSLKPATFSKNFPPSKKRLSGIRNSRSSAPVRSRRSAAPTKPSHFSKICRARKTSINSVPILPGAPDIGMTLPKRSAMSSTMRKFPSRGP